MPTSFQLSVSPTDVGSSTDVDGDVEDEQWHDRGEPWWNAEEGPPSHRTGP